MSDDPATRFLEHQSDRYSRLTAATQRRWQAGGTPTAKQFAAVEAAAPLALVYYRRLIREAEDRLGRLLSRHDASGMVGCLTAVSHLQRATQVQEFADGRILEEDVDLVAQWYLQNGALKPETLAAPVGPIEVANVLETARTLKWALLYMTLAQEDADPPDGDAYTSIEISRRYLSTHARLRGAGGTYPRFARAAESAVYSSFDSALLRQFGFSLAHYHRLLQAMDQSMTRGLQRVRDRAVAGLPQREPLNWRDSAAATATFDARFYPAASKLLPTQDALLEQVAMADRAGVTACIAALTASGSGGTGLREYAESPFRQHPLAAFDDTLAMPTFSRQQLEVARWPDALLGQGQDYSKRRADAYERFVVHGFADHLEGSRFGTPMYYDQAAGQVEVDGVVSYEDIIFLIEAKATRLQASVALRGDRQRVASALEKVLGKAATQLGRSAAYVDASLGTSGTVTFSYSPRDGQHALAVPAVRKTHSVLTNLHGAFDLGTFPALLDELSVQANHRFLQVLSGPAVAFLLDYLPSPALFVAYLDYREEMMSHRQVYFCDEDDLLAAFLLGLDFPETESEQLPFSLTLGPFLDDRFNQYEKTHPDNIGGIGQALEKKKLRKKTSRPIRELVAHLESTRPDGWLAAASLALRIPLIEAQQADRCHLRPGDQFRLTRRTLLMPAEASGEALEAAVQSASQDPDAGDLRRYFLVTPGRKFKIRWAAEWRNEHTVLPSL